MYSSKSIETRLFEPTLTLRMKGFRKLRLVLAKIDLSNDPAEIIDEQHVVLLKPNENKSEDLFTYIVEKERLTVIKTPCSGFRVSLEYRAEGRIKTKIRIREYFFCEIPNGDQTRMIEKRIQRSRFQCWKWS
jgi:hypothetical protein